MTNNMIKRKPVLQVVDINHPLWDEVTQQVSRRYQHAFGAVLQTYMPTFLVMMSGERIISICGYRSAKREGLFLEQYLTGKVEVVLSNEFEHPISRSKLVEFGQLSVFTRRTSPAHFLMIAEFLVSQGFEWGVCTATDPLYALMSRLGLQPTLITDADKDCVPDANQTWGSYYQTQPRVLAGNLKMGLEHLRSLYFDTQTLSTGS